MKHIISSLFFIVIIGCNPFDDSENEQLALEQQRQEDIRREKEEHERFAKALTDYVNGRQKLLKEMIAWLKSDAQALKDDIANFSRIIALGGEEKSSTGKELTPETKLLHLLRNQEVNGLAKKYLSADFVILQHEFINRVRDARADESRYRKALEQSDAIYSDILKESQKWVNATKEQRGAEISRLQDEIRSWERRRDDYQKTFQGLTKRTLVGNASKERERREQIAILGQKIGDADIEISRKRRQIDFLRNPIGDARMESQAATRKQSVQSQANSQRDRELYIIERYYKPKATVTEVVTDTSKKTIEKLQGVMAEKCQTIEKELAEAKDKEIKIREYLLAIPVSTMIELKTLRSKIEKL